MLIRAQLACVSPPLCPLEPDHSSPTSTVSLWARVLASHPHHVPLSLSTHFSPRPCFFKPGHSSLAPTMSLQAQVFKFVSHLTSMFFQAQALVFHPNRVSFSLPSHRSSFVTSRSPHSPCTFSTTSVTLINWFVRQCIYTNAHSIPIPSLFLMKKGQYSPVYDVPGQSPHVVQQCCDWPLHSCG